MGTTTETRITSTQAKDAIYKAHSIGSSASEIDKSVGKNSVSILGTDFYDYIGRKSITDVSRWTQFGAAASGTPIFDNNSNFSKFGKSLRIGNSTFGASTTAISKLIRNPITLDLTDYDIFTVWLYLDGNPVDGSTETHSASSYGALQLTFGDSYITNSSKFKIIGGVNGSFHKGWNNVTIRKDITDGTTGTGCNWSAVTDIGLYFQAGVGNIGTPCSFEIIASKLPTYKTPVCITLDDTEADTIELTNIMNSYGIPVTIFAIDKYIDSGATGYMTMSELKNLYSRGNAVGMHGAGIGEYITTHSRMLEATTWLKNNGFIRDNCHLYGSYPNGMYNQASIDYAKSIGVKSLRALKGTIESDVNLGEASTTGVPFECIANGGIADMFRVNSSRPSNLVNYTSELTQAIAKKACYITYHHKFTEFVNRAEWINLAKYLKSKVDDGTIECLTYPQFCRKYE